MNFLFSADYVADIYLVTDVRHQSSLWVGVANGLQNRPYFFRVFQESESKGETAKRGARDKRDGGVSGAPRSLRACLR